MVLVVDDDKELADSLCKAIQLAGLPCITAGSARAGLAKLRERPDIQVVVLDLRMGDTHVPAEFKEFTGMYFLAHYRDHAPQARVIVLTAYSTIDTAVPALSGGSEALALAYLEKPVSTADLILRIRSMLRQVVVDEFRLDMVEQVAYCNDERLPLTPKEYAALEVFMLQPGKWITYPELAKAIYGLELDVQEAHNKLKSFLSRLRQTLRKSSGRDVLEGRYGVGQIFRRKR